MLQFGSSTSLCGWVYLAANIKRTLEQRIKQQHTHATLGIHAPCTCARNIGGTGPAEEDAHQLAAHLARHRHLPPLPHAHGDPLGARRCRTRVLCLARFAVMCVWQCWVVEAGLKEQVVEMVAQLVNIELIQLAC